MDLIAKNDEITLTCDFIQKKKIKKDLKLEKVKSSYMLGCVTPKNIESSKDSHFKSPASHAKKSNQTGKLSSMPASPNK